MLTCYGEAVEPKVGSLIKIDDWPFACPLREGDSFSPFRVPTGQTVIKSLAVKIEFTGRTIQWKSNGPRVRIKIIFVGDCEPDEQCGGWLLI